MSASVEVFRKYPNPVFIETGMGQGVGIHQALFAGFRDIYSIELSPFLYRGCRNIFKADDRVKLFLGDTVHVLPLVLQLIDEPVTFWLDAHYSGGATVKGDVISPLLQELQIIGAHPIKTHTIMIDDLRDWTIKQHGFDTQMLIGALNKINPNYQIGYENGAVADDILVARI